MPHVEGRPQYSETDKKVGSIIQSIFHFMFNFYFVVSAIGVVGYLFHFEKLVYGAALICLVVFVISLFVGSTFTSGIIFLPVGAGVSFMCIDKSLCGICLGIFIVFIIRHILRNIFFDLIGKLVGMASR